MRIGQLKSLLTICVVIALCAMATRSAGQISIPDSSGFSGFVLVGPGYFNIANSFLVSGAPLIGEVGDPVVSSITDAPVANGVAAFPFVFELNYTFGKSHTQLFFGNQLEDILRLDVRIGIGLRQELRDKSILTASLLLTPLELKFWSDPYIEGEERQPTGLYFPGLRLRWSHILKTGLVLTTTYRQYRYNEEKSGEWLVNQGRIDLDEVSLLDRNGDVFKLEALYRINLNKHRLSPSIRYWNEAHNGAAMAQKGYTIQLTYLYQNPKWILDVNLLYGNRKANEIHPVYDTKLDANRYGGSITMFFPVKMYKRSVLSIFIGGEVFAEYSNVDFFDSHVNMIMTGVVWRHRPGVAVKSNSALEH